MVDLLKPDAVLLQGIGDEQQSVLETERAGVRDALDEEMPRVLARRDLAGKRPRRRAVAGGWGTAAEGFVEPLVVIKGPEVVESALLGFIVRLQVK
jgi:hypothetical protein